MDEFLGFVRAHRWPVVSALGVVFLAGSLVGAAYAYDASQARVIASGVHVGRVDVGGLTPAAARHKLRRAYRPLERPLVVRAGPRRFTLTERAARLAFHVDRAVSQALARSRRGWFLSRAVRELAGHDVNAQVGPPIAYSAAAVDRFVHRVQAKVEQPVRNARVQPSADSLVVVRGRDGIVVDATELWREVRRALVSVDAARVIPVPRTHRTPKMTVAKLRLRYPSFVTVDRDHFQLRVYQELKPARTYSIAVGQIGLETPAGLYHIQNKQVDPSWAVPDSSWAGSLAGAVIPPGPDDPLKARWLGIFSGAGIHGTEDTGSIGSAASHGCIRMTIPDVIDLYDRVEVGTPIYIG